MKNSILFLMSLLLVMGSIADLNAQAVRNGVERAQDRNQIANDKAIIQRDRQEIADFRATRAALSAAVNNGNQAKVRAKHQQLIADMEREIAQGAAKLKQDNREIAQSKSEVRSDRREVRRDVRQGKPLQAADDRRDKRDDRRDLADDKNDRNEQIRRNNRQKEILAVFKAIKVKENPKALSAIKGKRALLEEFEQTLIRDMGENWEELGEDKRELREDRRETREDRRQR